MPTFTIHWLCHANIHHSYTNIHHSLTLAYQHSPFADSVMLTFTIHWLYHANIHHSLTVMLTFTIHWLCHANIRHSYTNIHHSLTLSYQHSSADMMFCFMCEVYIHLYKLTKNLMSHCDVTMTASWAWSFIYFRCFNPYHSYLHHIYKALAFT